MFYCWPTRTKQSHPHSVTKVFSTYFGNTGPLDDEHANKLTMVYFIGHHQLLLVLATTVRGTQLVQNSQPHLWFFTFWMEPQPRDNTGNAGVPPGWRITHSWLFAILQHLFIHVSVLGWHSIGGKRPRLPTSLYTHHCAIPATTPAVDFAQKLANSHPTTRVARQTTGFYPMFNTTYLKRSYQVICHCAPEPVITSTQEIATTFNRGPSMVRPPGFRHDHFSRSII